MRPSTWPLVLLMGCALLLCAVSARETHSAKFAPSRVTVEKKTSLKGQQARHSTEHQRASAREQHAALDAEVIEHRKSIAEKMEAMEAEPNLSEEDRDRWMREINREKKEFEEGRARKGHDPLYAIRKRKDEQRMAHDEVHAEAPRVHPPETVAHLHEIHESRSLQEYFTMDHRGYHGLLVVEAPCEHCAEAVATFERAAARIADSEYHHDRQNRAFRFAVLNVTAAPQLLDDLKSQWHLSQAEMAHFPIAVFVNERINPYPPHFVEYRSTFEADLDAAFRRIQAFREAHAFRDEDELMHCAFEHQHDGVAFAVFIDREELSTEHLRVESVTRSAFYDLAMHAPICMFTTNAQGYQGNLSVNVTKEGDGHVIHDDTTVEFLTRINPDGAHVGAFFVDEANHDDVTAEYFTFDSALMNTVRPPRRTTVAELQRFRRWIERALGRRHLASGRRFRGVHRRQAYTTVGDSYCHDNATIGDTVTATVRATSVDHKHTFFETAAPTKFVVGEPVVGLPPWLHDIFVGSCAPSTREVYSPPSQGFAAELVEITVSKIEKPRLSHPGTQYTGADIPTEVHSLGIDADAVAPDDEL